MTLLVTGASGFLGRHLCRRARSLGMPVVGTYMSRPLDIPGVTWHQLDVTSAVAVDALVRSVTPSAVIHTAFALAPSLATDTAINWAVNAVGAANVARAVASVGGRLVQLSTDAVHRGREKPFTEADAPSPVYPYGAAKAAAELAVSMLVPAAVIARVSLINSDVAAGGEATARDRFMVDLCAGRASGVLFTDDVRCPIAVTDLASALIELAVGDFAGVINLGGPDVLSFYDLGVLVALANGFDPATVPSSTIAAAGALRPGNVVLDISLATALLGTRLRGIREVFAR